MTKKVKTRLEKATAAYNKALKKRTTGTVKVEFNSMDDIKWVRTTVKNKLAWQGQEAIQVVGLMSKLEALVKEGVEQVEEIYPVDLEIHILEPLIMMIQKYEGKGFHEAQTFLKVLMPVLAAYGELKKLDTKLQEAAGEVQMAEAEEAEIAQKKNAEGLEEATAEK